ncbi:hypothetical protein H7Y63_01210 [Polaromonas sp.]|nr:hypothetical protein [Candidatus Saccharibacteria bacterium]
MNPSSNEAGGINLPPPISPENPLIAAPAGANGSPELGASGPEARQAVQAASAPIALPVPTAPVPQVPISTVINTTNSTTPAVADDTDLIEKEWVSKAKEIINKTQNDPNLQSKELNMFKADYMQKRYNKVLKLSE